MIFTTCVLEEFRRIEHTTGTRQVFYLNVVKHSVDCTVSSLWNNDTISLRTGSPLTSLSLYNFVCQQAQSLSGINWQSSPTGWLAPFLSASTSLLLTKRMNKLTFCSMLLLGKWKPWCKNNNTTCFGVGKLLLLP